MFGKLVKPCPICPFRLEPRFHGLRRAPEIADGMRIQDGSFPCHETTGDEDNPVPKHQQEHCAGAVKVMLAERVYNQMMRISGRLGFFKPEDYAGGAMCFDSFDDWIEAMKE